MKPPRPDYRLRSLLSFSPPEIDQLRKESAILGLRLASYLKHLITTHPGRKTPNVKRAG